MSLSMYQASVPVLIRALGNLSNLLAKGQAHCTAKKIDETVMTGSRLYPDMFPLARQVMIATDMSKGCGARLAGIEIPKYEDNEKTFDELKARLGKTIDFLKSLDRAAIDASVDKDVTLALRSGNLTFKASDYLFNYALPNVFFHSSTAYAILRHNGVEIGKGDFLGA